MTVAPALCLATSTAKASWVEGRAQSAPDRWKGSILLAPGQTLDFTVVFNLDESGSGTATMSIPMQGLKDGGLRDVSQDPATGLTKFTLGLPQMPPPAWAHFEVTISKDAPTARGSMKQAGATFAVEMSRLADGETGEPRRPQEPKPPFPYSAREVTYTNSMDGATLAGTLTVPAEKDFGKGPFPAVLLITGSGPQDRDETLLGHKPFLVIADHLTRRGIAVLRVDDRGVGGSTSPKAMQETTLDYVGDVLAGVQFLKTAPEVAPTSIGLIGHSEGGLIAPMVAAQSTDVAFMVLLAGPGVPGIEILQEQMVAIARAEGTDAEKLQELGAAQKQLLAAATLPASDPQRESAMDEAIDHLIKVQSGGKELAPHERAAAVASAKKSLDGPWMQTFLTLDPRIALAKAKCPALVINGGLDTQVVASQNVPEVVKALLSGGNQDVTARVFPNLNHLFQTTKTGAFSEYAKLEETFNPQVLDEMTGWVKSKAGGDMKK
jgi:pimeloyl-ACP methyl ester carboxylesterase